MVPFGAAQTVVVGAREHGKVIRGGDRCRSYPRLSRLGAQDGALVPRWMWTACGEGTFPGLGVPMDSKW